MSIIDDNLLPIALNTYTVQVRKTHLNATVGITAKAIIIYRTALEVWIAITENLKFNQESNGTRKKWRKKQ